MDSVNTVKRNYFKIKASNNIAFDYNRDRPFTSSKTAAAFQQTEVLQSIETYNASLDAEKLLRSYCLSSEQYIYITKRQPRC